LSYICCATSIYCSALKLHVFVSVASILYLVLVTIVVYAHSFIVCSNHG
jgi:hypothetical protein